MEFWYRRRERLEADAGCQYLEGRSIAVLFAWSVVQPESDRRAASLAQMLHRRALGVHAALPGVIGRGKVEDGTCRSFDVSIAVELGAVVDGDRLEQVAVRADQLNNAAVRGCNRART